MLKCPRKSESLQKLVYLKRRTMLSEDDEVALYTGLQGYQGEKKFASVVEQSLQKEYTVLYDIFLKQQNNHFQMDTLIIQEKLLYLIEIKYFHGDYYSQDNHLYHVNSKKRLKTPLINSREASYYYVIFYRNINSHIMFNPMLFLTTLHSHYTKHQFN